MGRKRYYCDYCDKTFPDSKEGRTKHVGGIQHQRMKKQHYDSFRDAIAIYEEEKTKTPCKNYFNATCSFGVTCRFSHCNIQQLQELKVRAEEQQNPKPTQLNSETEPSLEDWHSKRAETSLTAPLWTLPEAFSQRTDLPPSLKPPCLMDFIQAKFTDWG